MWCTRCRQDVPGFATGESEKLRCPRCSGELRAQVSTPRAEPSAPQETSGTDATAHAAPAWDNWEVDESLRHIGRVLRPSGSDKEQQEAAYRQMKLRLDPPHQGPSAWHAPRLAPPRRAPGPDGPDARPGLAALTWGALSVGTMAFVCGGILLGWSLVSGRAELWSVGVPVALAGQISLLLGLVLQLDRLWHDSRRASVKLDEVDRQLHDLRATTTLLSTGNHSPGTAFYAHLSHGAGPQLLLTDLKSQLDLLAARIMNDEC